MSSPPPSRPWPSYYSAEWVVEAKKRGLLNLRRAPEALKELVTKQSRALFTKLGVLTKEELESRHHIRVERYVKDMLIELVGELVQELQEFREDLSDIIARAEAKHDDPPKFAGAAFADQEKAYKKPADHLRNHRERGRIFHSMAFREDGHPRYAPHARRSTMLLLLLVLSCEGCKVRNFGLDRTVPPADAPAAQVALAGAKLMIGAGDIARCEDIGDEATARLVDSVLKANEAANVETVVFTLGDHAYPEASDSYLRQCFTPSWGDSQKRIMKVIRPSIGNHDYMADRAAPNYRYFGDRIGPSGKGYYSYEVGDWHVIVLNSELAVDGTAAEKSAQLEWLRRDLADHQQLCTLSYFHKPLFTSSYRQGVSEMRAIWTILYGAGVDLILSGHDHHYERFLPQSPAGAVDTVKGIEQILVGTGGATLRGFRSRFGLRGRELEANSAVQIQGRFGVLLLTLGKTGYQSAFLDTEGGVWDRRGRECH